MRGAPAIGFWTAVALVLGNMIGSGVFLLPASLAGLGGLAILGWLLSACGATVLALVFARLARARPAPGGFYAYSREAFGDPIGFLVAWGYWVSLWSGCAALAIAFVSYLDPLLPLARDPTAAAALALAAVWGLTLVNLLGVRRGGEVQVVTTVAKLLPLLLVGVAGAIAFDASRFALPERSHGSPGSGLSQAALLTVWAFLGLESATIPAASMREPARTIPRATVTGVLLAAGLYLLATVGVMSAVPPEALSRSAAPFADAARRLWGAPAAILVALGAAISSFGTLNGQILLAGQLPLAVAQDGLFPRLFGRLSRRGAPALGLVVSGVLASVLLLMNASGGLVAAFTLMIQLSTLSTLVPYVVSTLAGFVLERRPGTGLTPGAWSTLVGVLALAFSVWVTGGSGLVSISWGLVLFLAGVPVYVWIARRRSIAQGLAPDARLE